MTNVWPVSEMERRVSFVALVLMTLSACARQADSAVAPDAPGFFLGIWHGFIFPVAWIFSLFDSKVAIYAIPNNGGWYDFGYFLGIVVFGVGARRGSRIIYRERVRYVPRKGETIIEHEP